MIVLSETESLVKLNF